MPKKYAELILVGAFFVLAVLLYGSTASYPNAVQGSTAAYVRFLAVCLGGLCAIQFVLYALRSLRHKKEVAPVAENADSTNATDPKISDEKQIFRLSKNPKPFWTLLVLLVIYASAYPYLGFYLASAIFLPVTMLVLGARNPISIVFTTAGVLAFVYAIFDKLLEVYMPIGSLTHW